jgi:hypothetical protein
MRSKSRRGRACSTRCEPSRPAVVHASVRPYHTVSYQGHHLRLAPVGHKKTRTLCFPWSFKSRGSDRSAVLAYDRRVPCHPRNAQLQAWPCGALNGPDQYAAQHALFAEDVVWPSLCDLVRTGHHSRVRWTASAWIARLALSYALSSLFEKTLPK